MSDTAQKQLQNAHTFLSLLSALDFAAMAELMAPDFKHEFCPASLPAPGGKTIRNKEETLEFFKHAWEAVFEYIKFLPPMDIIQGNDAVVLHVKSDGMSKSGLKYDNEYMLTFRFDGEKIVGLKEFADSKYVTDYFAALHAK
ncbi:hypothetical protein R3P38DRAFT_2951431 [Favolaschia claudopus]|uniref:SnoaL-like domain-containing protein n=1 Tax=Favolaschia claudopus TaxID=2862362 RepID=A0AAW0BFJ3_9AGAR